MTALTLSNSEMSCFRNCRRHWYLAHYRRLIPRADAAIGSPISIGNCVHDALAAYYDPAVRADPVNFAHTRVLDAINEDPRFEEETLKEWDLVRIMLEGYLEWLEDTAADADLRYLGSERKAEARLTNIAGTDVYLISKLDAVVEQVSDGALLALEHKTVSGFKDRLEIAKVDSQLLTEHLVRFLEAMDTGLSADDAYELCHGVLLNMLRKVKRTARATPPFYERIIVPHNIHELRSHWKHCIGIASQIIECRQRLDEGQSHHVVCPPNPNPSNRWSNPFFKLYHMFDDGSRVEAALEAMFEVGDPLQRYDGALDINE